MSSISTLPLFPPAAFPKVVAERGMACGMLLARLAVTGPAVWVLLERPAGGGMLAWGSMELHAGLGELRHMGHV